MPTVNYEHLMDMGSWTVNDDAVDFMYWGFGEPPEGGDAIVGLEGTVVLTGVIDEVPLEIKAEIEYEAGNAYSFHAKVISSTSDVDVDVDLAQELFEEAIANGKMAYAITDNGNHQIDSLDECRNLNATKVVIRPNYVGG